ncbi:MAG: hypothetical protein ABI183_22810 [Polyangiaceae bacterium]
MNPPPPASSADARSDEIDLYVHTYTSLLRSSGEVRVRAFEEAHAYSGASLHPHALTPIPDVSAFAYAAGRLPEEILSTDRIILGQSHELFEAAGLDVYAWKTVKARGRRRPLRHDEKTRTLAVFIASESDIDDLVPIVTAYQIEWNKMFARLKGAPADASEKDLFARLGLEDRDADVVRDALTPTRCRQALAAMALGPLDLKMRMLAPSYSQYQRAAQRWWSGIEPAYMQTTPTRRPPVYFVSSNTHAIANLLGGYAIEKKAEIFDFAQKKNPEGLAQQVALAREKGDAALLPFIYYLLRPYLRDGHSTNELTEEIRAFERAGGITHLSEPGHIDVDAQIIELSKIDPARIDPRLLVPEIEALVKSDALIVNIDYPLGMAAYHLLSRLGQGVGELRGIYVMGKAATLNGRVGDVALSGAVHDEHSKNTYMFENCFVARDVSPYLMHGSVFDNQSALTVRSAFLQNKTYMNAYYREGYTVLEMEAGPFLSCVYELLNPTEAPHAEIVSLGTHAPFDIGIMHYASDTPNSRRQSLLSKSLSYFGVDATYACAIAIVRRILSVEAARLTDSRDGEPRDYSRGLRTRI